MYRALPVSRQVAPAARGLVRATRRRITTEAAHTPPPVPKKKKRTLRRIIITSGALTGVFYVSSAFVAFNNQQYYDFFSDSVPFGSSMLDFAESHDWDTVTLKQASEWPEQSYSWVLGTFNKLKGYSGNPQETLDKAKHAVEERVGSAKSKAIEAYTDSKNAVQSAASHLKTEIVKEEKDGSLLNQATAIAKHQEEQLVGAISELVHKAEEALSDEKGKDKAKEVEVTPQVAADAASFEDTDVDAKPAVDPHIYSATLPLGFEPPPGFSRPAPPPKKVVEAPKEEVVEPVQPVLPLVAPAVSELGASEPIIAQLAGTIDNLASYLNANPTAASKATDILETAKVDLTALATRIEKVKDEERLSLEQRLDEQTREYSLKLLELEMEAQDKLDSQEDGFRKFFDEQKAQFAQAYREKLENELRTQTELINERLKEEVIAQGIEMQRRWIRDIKVRVEQERGGRLAKIEELSANLKRLERIALDNSTYLDENIRIHSLWSAIRSVHGAVESPVRKPFREELRVLRHLAESREDPVSATALDSLEASEIPDVGVEPLADLISWFNTSVAPRVASVALVPDQDAGLLSYLASHLFSTFRFRRQGLVEGSDVLSTIARAEFYMNEKDLDSAARELNQLKGAPKALLEDWLEAARRRLEVQQALEVIQTQATLASLLVV